MSLSILMCYDLVMRTTLSLDDDVAAAVQRLREERHIGLSDAVNELIRAGLVAPPQKETFRQRTADLGLRIDVSSVADALEQLDGPTAR
jgi:Arc/MetJ family transcription regulator